MSPPSELICELASQVLKINYFAFEKRFFLQISGVAMGSTLAPNYAILYMGYFEHKSICELTRTLTSPRCSNGSGQLMIFFVCGLALNKNSTNSLPFRTV